MRVPFLWALVMCLVACSHAKDSKRDDSAEKGARSGKAAAGRKTPDRDEGSDRKKVDPRAPKVNGPAEPMTTSKSTKKMFKPEGLKKLQQALDGKLGDIEKKKEQVEKKKDEVEEEKAKLKVPLADLDGVDQTGELDARTQEALRAFQRAEKLPETGLPDYESLRRLGLKPDEVYHHEPPAERGAVH